MDAMEKEALPSKRGTPMLIPGVHHDTTIAHEWHYYAGWSDCLKALRSLPTDTDEPALPPEEELFAHEPSVQAIDEDLKKINPHSK